MGQRNRLLYGMIALACVATFGYRARQTAQAAQDTARAQSSAPQQCHAPSSAMQNVQVPGARAATAKESRAAQASIRGQLNAFKRNDYRAAVKYQSSGMRRQFASVDTFRTMIRRGYPQFANFKSVTFAPMRASKDGTMLFSPVKLTGQDGVTVAAIYQMTRENGAYHISGVQGGAAFAPDNGPRAPRRAPAPGSISA